MDSWLNVLTGVGGTSSKAGAFTFTARDQLPDATLQALYEQDGFAAAIIDCVPDEALRQGFSVTTGDEAAADALASAMERLGARQRLNEAWAWGRLYGGGAVFVGADDGRDPREPLDLGAVRSVRFLTVLERQDITPRAGSPTRSRSPSATWRSTASPAPGRRRERHPRGARFAPLALLRRADHGLAARAAPGLGVSELQRVYDKLQQFNATFAAVGSCCRTGRRASSRSRTSSSS